MNQILFKLDNLVEGLIINRPSKHIKSPYVADIGYINSNDIILGHTASLGCCGLADKNAKILMSKSPESKIKTKPKNHANLKCTYTVYLSILENRQIVGIHPKLAENLVESALKMNYLSILKNIKRYRRETVIYIKDKVDSRFDFTGIDENGIPFIMEVKNVPLADFEDVTSKERDKMDFSSYPIDSKVAYFPDGYRKKSTDPVSPRALKHIKELTFIKSQSKTRCIMCYVIQRTDVNRFQPSVIDPEYREAFKDALKSGVEIITMVVNWDINGVAYFVRDDLPITQEL